MRAHPLRSIMTRIFAGFFLVLLLLAVMAAMVWRAGQEVGQALRADELSQAADVRIDEVQGALTEARLRMAAYLRTEGAAERGALAVAIDRLQAAADMRDSSPQDIDLSSVAATIQPVRAALSNVAEAIAARRSAVAALVAASAALSNSSTGTGRERRAAWRQRPGGFGGRTDGRCRACHHDGRTRRHDRGRASARRRHCRDRSRQADRRGDGRGQRGLAASSASRHNSRRRPRHDANRRYQRAGHQRKA